MTLTKHNFLTRTITGVVFVVVVLAAMLAGRGSYFALLLFVAGWCSIEFWRIARSLAVRWMGVLVIVLCMVAMWFFPTIGDGMTDGVPGWDVRIAPAFMMVVWANDIFAYLVGITLGRHKMSPKISPHKSWEGFAGGITGATIASALLGRLWLGGDVWLWTAFGVLVALAAVGGDLLESSFKRAAGVKDSGRLLPGHGGLLDRFDATLGAVPVAFMFFLVTHWLL
ncbi:MAG: phosphatidate cytidylyltransferase [Alistipes sp.]|jgi:phosphatidate cytidylyltransferase|nr:phosphatidate cytidylyltransferase [Alistipes sp.]